MDPSLPVHLVNSLRACSGTFTNIAFHSPEFLWRYFPRRHLWCYFSRLHCLELFTRRRCTAFHAPRECLALLAVHEGVEDGLVVGEQRLGSVELSETPRVQHEDSVAVEDRRDPVLKHNKPKCVNSTQQ